MKQFFPDIAYSKKKRWEALGLFALLLILIGGFATYMFLSKQPMMGAIMLIFLVIPLASIPSTFMNYPTKNVPLIEVDGGKIIAQRAFPYEGNDPEEVHRIGQKIEHQLYVETIAKLIK